MTLLQRLYRNPTVLLGFVVAVLAVVVAFGPDLTDEQTGSLVGVIAAAIVLLRAVLTPSAEVLAQQRPGDVAPVAGPAAAVTTGAPVDVALVQLPPPDPNRTNEPLDGDPPDS